mmetsp:Transcript_124820/g.195587  ORF Transcript_124820/g.195587 Transcript_124820/m.195587 type:complete len:174 (+) Transcript_124820:1-522(+)
MELLQFVKERAPKQEMREQMVEMREQMLEMRKMKNQIQTEMTQLEDEAVKKEMRYMKARTDMRTGAYSKRLQQKLVDRRSKLPPNGLLEVVCEEASAGVLNGSGVCAVCLDTEGELGKAFPFVFAGCGHKCLCKSCLRKMKKKKKRDEIECPLCRQCSKPVLCARYEGNLFAA